MQFRYIIEIQDKENGIAPIEIYGLEQLFILMTQYLETVILGDVQHLFLSPNFRSLELRSQSGNHVVAKGSTWGLAKCTLHLLV